MELSGTHGTAVYDPYGENKDMSFHIEDREKEKHILLFVSLGCGTSFFFVFLFSSIGS